MSPHQYDIDIRLSPRRTLQLLLVITATLIAAHLLIVVGSEVSGHPLYYLPRLFDLGQEANLPTFISALFLLAAALLLALIAASAHRRGLRGRWGWTGLAAGFGIMSLDEAAQIHDELIGAVLYRVWDKSDIGWHYTWYLVYLPLLLLLALVYIPFLRALPRRFLLLFLGAGVLYVGGAVGIEILEASMVGSGTSAVVLHLSKAVEEAAEMAGVAVFIYSLLLYVQETGPACAVRIGGPYEESELPEREAA